MYVGRSEREWRIVEYWQVKSDSVKKPSFNAIISTTNPTRTGLGSNPSLLGEGSFCAITRLTTISKCASSTLASIQVNASQLVFPFYIIKLKL
jgi:hypothetical protein